ncbi:MAG: winged helix-turn-helix domain-containing protein [Bryobacteraceae bacterium]
MREQGQEPGFQLGSEFQLYPARRSILRGGEPVPLPSRAFDVLLLLIEQRHRPLSKEEILSRVWGDISVSQNNLNQAITALRKALGDTRQSSQYIATIPNVGYQLVASATPLVEEAPAARRHIPRFAWGIAAIAALIILTATQWHRSQPLPTVPPFTNLQQDDDFAWLAHSLSQQAQAQLAGSSNVISGAYFLPSQGQLSIKITAKGSTREATGPLHSFTALLSDTLRSLPGSPALAPAMDLYAQGLDAWRQSHLETAIPLLRQSAAAGPRNPLILSALAALIDETGHFAESRLLNQQAFALRANLPPSGKLLIEARHHTSRGEWQPAIDRFTQLWNTQPNHFETAFELATVQFRARLTSDAQSTLDTLSKFNDSAARNPRFLLLSARIQGQFANMEQTRQLASAAAAEARRQKAALVEGRAILLASGATQNLGRLPDAQRLRQQAKAICEPLHDIVCLASIHRIDGNVALSHDRVKEAVQSYGKALELARLAGNPREYSIVIGGLGQALLRDGQFRQAEAVFRSALKLDLVSLGVNPEGFYAPLAESLLAQGRYQEAGDLGAKVASFGESSSDKETAARGYLTQALARQSDPSAAPLFEKAIQLLEAVKNPELSKSALLHYAHYLTTRHSFDRAGSVIAQAETIPSPLHQPLLRDVRQELQRLTSPVTR